jgi:hypothetical protein
MLRLSGVDDLLGGLVNGEEPDQGVESFPPHVASRADHKQLLLDPSVLSQSR